METFDELRLLRHLLCRVHCIAVYIVKRAGATLDNCSIQYRYHTAKHFLVTRSRSPSWRSNFDYFLEEKGIHHYTQFRVLNILA